MLEEALLDEKRNPSETAMSMLSFLQFELTASGASAEARFCNNLFGPLCERIFGGIILEDGNASNKYLHKPGGWLSAQTRWSRLPEYNNAGVLNSASTASMSSASTAASTGTSSSTSTASARLPSSSNTSRTEAGNWESDAVVRLLATTTNHSALSISSKKIKKQQQNHQQQPQVLQSVQPLPPTLVEAISSESDHRPNVGFRFPFHALPMATQEAWMAVFDLSFPSQPSTAASTTTANAQPYHRQQVLQQTSLVVTDNDKRLFGEVLRNSLIDQPDLLRLHTIQREQQRKQLQYQQNATRISPLNFSSGVGSPVGGVGGGVGLSPRSFTFPTSTNSTVSFAQQQRQQQQQQTMMMMRQPIQFHTQSNNASSDQVIFSMLEYYLVLFIRFPLALPTAATARSSAAHQNYAVYSTNASSGSRINQGNVPFGEQVYIYLFNRYLGHFLPYTADQGRSIVLNNNNRSTSPNLQSELFLRLTLSLWMEAPMRLAPTAKVLESLYDGTGSSNTTMLTTATTAVASPPTLALQTFTLNRSYEMVQVDKNCYFQPPPSHVQSCLRKLILHLLADPAIEESIVMATTKTAPLLPNHALWVVQPSFYNYIRATLRYASIHTSDRAFSTALELWLMWLEPWKWSSTSINKTKMMMSRLPTQLSHNNSSKYSPDWEPYIAANLHLYLTPLAIFLRRSRELDFSPNMFASSIRTVKRVFQVFSQDVVRALTQNYQRLVFASSSSSSQPSSTSSSSSSYLLLLVQQHMKNLGQFAPPVPPPIADDASLSPLTSCQGDVHSLVEEVSSQLVAKIRNLSMVEQIWATAKSRMGMGVLTGEVRDLEELVRQAISIFGLPPDFKVFPNGIEAAHLERISASSANAEEGEGLVSRTKEGLLTQRGREQLIRGEAKLRPHDTVFVRDKMRGRVRPHEIAILVKFFVYLSDVINAKMGLTATTTTTSTHSFQVNLRFLADYRNLWVVLGLAIVMFKATIAVFKAIF